MSRREGGNKKLSRKLRAPRSTPKSTPQHINLQSPPRPAPVIATTPTNAHADRFRTLPMPEVQLEFMEDSFDVGAVFVSKDTMVTEGLLQVLCCRPTDRPELLEFFLQYGATLKKFHGVHPLVPALQQQNTKEADYLRSIELILRAGVSCTEEILHNTTVLDLAFIYGTTAAVATVLEFYGDVALEYCVTPRWMIWSLLGHRKKLHRYLHRRKKGKEPAEELNQLHPLTELFTPEQFAHRGSALLCAASANRPGIIEELMHYGARLGLTEVTCLNFTKSNNPLPQKQNFRRSVGAETTAQHHRAKSGSLIRKKTLKETSGSLPRVCESMEFIKPPEPRSRLRTSSGGSDDGPSEETESYLVPNPIQVSSSLYNVEATAALLSAPEVTEDAIFPIFVEGLLQFWQMPYSPKHKDAQKILKQLGAFVSLERVVTLFKDTSSKDYDVLKYLAFIFCKTTEADVKKYQTENNIDGEVHFRLQAATLCDHVPLLKAVGTRRALNYLATDPAQNVWYQAAVHDAVDVLDALFVDGLPHVEIVTYVLMMFVFHGRHQFVRILCEKLGDNFNVNEALEYNELTDTGDLVKATKTPLQLASEKNHLGVAQVLFANGAQLDHVGKKSKACDLPPLFLALTHGSTELVSWFITAGADVNITAPMGGDELSILQYALRVRNLSAADLLMEKGANMKKPSALAALLSTYPHQFPPEECRRYIKKFFRAGCSVHDQMVDYQSRMNIAVFAGCFSGSKEMVDHLWAVNILRDQRLFMRAIIISCQYGQEDIVKYLMSHYAEQKKPAPLNIKQALKIAIRSEHLGITRFLLQSELVRCEIPVIDDKLAIDYALERNNFELFSTLLGAGQVEPSGTSYKHLVNPSQGGDIDSRFFDAFADIDTAELTFAVLASNNSKFHEELIHLLGDSRLRPNERNDSGQTLLLACYDAFPGDYDLLEVLLRREDIDPNCSQIVGNITLLFAASLRGDAKTVALLLETHGRSLECDEAGRGPNNHMITPIYAATMAYIEGRQGGLEIVKMLVDRVDPTSCSETDIKYSEQQKDQANEAMMQMCQARRQSASSSLKLSSNNTQNRSSNFRNETALHLACSVGCIELIDVLGQRFSFTTSVDVMTPALYLVTCDQPNSVDGNDPDFPLLTKYLEKRDLETKSNLNVEALSLAVYQDNVLLVDYLLKRGLDPNSRGRFVRKQSDGECKMSDSTYVLCHAAELGRRSILDRILNDDRVNVRTAGGGLPSYQEGWPLRVAYKSGYLLISAKILSRYPTFDAQMIISDILGSNGTAKPESEAIFDKLREGLLNELNMKIDQIPERFQSPPDRTLQYLYDLAQGQQEFRRLRVIIVGPAAAGKTTIVKRLVGDYWNGTQLQHFDEAYAGYGVSNATKKKRKRKGVTDGIDVHYWKPPDQSVAIFLWDFAGQDIYYTTHQFFLAPNSLYLIVFNANLPLKHGNIVYWLNSLQSRVKGQQVLLIATHADKLSKRDHRLQELNEEIQCIYDRWAYQFEPGEDLIRLVPQEDGMLIWPVGKKESLKHLENAMIRSAEERQPIPNKYMLLRNQVNHLRNSTSPPVVERKKLIQLAQRVGIGSREVNLALELLHEWGELMYFPSGWHLGKKIILDPRWLSDLFKTVSSFKFRGKEGQYSPFVTLAELKERWRAARFGPELDLFLIELLEHFQIMVKAPRKEDVYIVPSLLSSEPPIGHWTPLRSLNTSSRKAKSMSSAADRVPTEEYYREYHLPFSPSGLISRLLAHFFLLGQRGDLGIVHYWEGGVVLADPRNGTDILVSLEDDNKTTFGRIIEVVIRGVHWRTHMAFFHSLVTSIIFEWYPGIRNRTKIYVGKSTQHGCELHVPYEACVDQFLQTPSAESSTIAELLPELTQPIIRWGQGDFQTDDLEQSRNQFDREVQIIKKLGGGMFGHVYKARWQDKLVAVKTLSADTPNRDDIMDFCKEVAVLKALDHPAIVKLLYFFPSPMAIVTELITGGDLEEILRTEWASITWDVLVKVLLDVARALRYMHSLEPPIYHNDIKVANVLVLDLNAQDPDVSVKLADVGCARMASAGESAGSTDCLSEEKTQFCGLLLDLFEGAMKASQGTCPAIIDQLIKDARGDGVAVPFFTNIVKRLQFIKKHLDDSTEEVTTKMEQLHVLEQLEGAVHANERDLVLDILASSELRALGKRGQKLTHQIFMSAIKKEDRSFFIALLDTNAWGVNTYLNDAHSYLIHTVCKLGNDVFLRILLERHVNLEAVDPVKGQTALHVSIEANHPKIVKILIANFANVDAVDGQGCTGAMIASRLGYSECLEQLIRGGVDPNTGFAHQNTPTDAKPVSLLKEALTSTSPQHTKCIKCLLENGATKPPAITSDQMQQILDCAYELFQFMCFAEPTVARQTAVGLISLFCSCNTIELQQLQALLGSVINENRGKQVSKRDRVFKLLDLKRGISIKPEIFEKTVLEDSRETSITFVLKNHNKSELIVLLLLPKSSHYLVSCPVSNLCIKAGGSATVTCDIVLQKPIISTVAILVEIESASSIEYHYIIARLFPLSQSQKTPSRGDVDRDLMFRRRASRSEMPEMTSATRVDTM